MVCFVLIRNRWSGDTMQYLKLRNSTRQVRKDGSKYTVPLYVHKAGGRFGKVTKEETVSTKKPILVTGAHDSGKSRWLSRMYEQERQIWGSKIKSPALWLGAFRPLAAWCETPQVMEWWEQRRVSSRTEEHPEGKYKPWASLKQWERTEALPDYIEDTRAVVFLDDAHKLSGRKLQIARECVMASRIFVISASEEQRLPPNLRGVIDRRDPQTYRLGTDVAYDMTKPLVWMIVVVAMGAGWFELAMILGGMTALSSGGRSTRQE